jgi:hypothetical protein
MDHERIQPAFAPDQMPGRCGEIPGARGEDRLGEGVVLPVPDVRGRENVEALAFKSLGDRNRCFVHDKRLIMYGQEFQDIIGSCI